MDFSFGEPDCPEIDEIFSQRMFQKINFSAGDKYQNKMAQLSRFIY